MDNINSSFDQLNKNLLEINNGTSDALKSGVLAQIVERFDEVVHDPTLRPVWEACQKKIIQVSGQQNKKVQEIVSNIINLDFSQKSKVFLICAKHDVDIILYESFMQKYNGNVNGASENDTPVSEAVRTRQFGILRVLKDLGSEIDQPIPSGDTPMILAVRYNHIEMVRELKSLGADIYKPNKFGDTPMILAVRYNHIEMVRELKSLGADIDKPNEFGDTPMILAVRYNHIEMVRELKSLGADIDKPDKFGYTPMIFAVTGNHYIEMVRELKSLGADIYKPDVFDYIPIARALNCNHEITELLQGYGADYEYAEEFLRRKMLAHIWGIKGESKLKNKSGLEIKFELEGLSPEFAMSQTSKYLKLFFDQDDSIPKQDQLEILYALENPVLIHSNNLTHVESIFRLHTGKPVVILGGSEYHAISIILFKDQLIVFNRGEGRVVDQAARAYQLSSTSVDQPMLKKLANIFSTTESFNKMIADLNLPYLYSFKHKDQKIGTCSVASSKGVFGVLCRLYTRETVVRYKGVFNYMFNKSEKEESYVKGRKIYKRFTAFMRKKSFDDYLKQVDPAKQDADLVRHITMKEVSRNTPPPSLLDFF